MIMISRVRDAIRDNALLSRGDTVCVAVSGGVDSTVLLHILYILKDEFELKLVVCHLNHNLRGLESTRDRNFVKRLAKGLGLQFEGAKLLKKDINAARGESLQEWARGRRLEFLTGCAKKHRAARIALGHNMDDQAETVFMRLIKGASLRGLSGMAWRRERFIRPVLGLSRTEIDAFASANSIDFVEDSSNKGKKYLRNRIRHELMPVLEGYNPRVQEAIARSAELLREDEAFLAEAAAVALKKVVTSSKTASRKKPRHAVTLDRKLLLSLTPSIFRRCFTGIVYSLSSEAELSVYGPQIDAFSGLVKGRAPNASLKLCEGLFARRDYDIITITSKAPKAVRLSEEELVLETPGKVRIKGLKEEVVATIIRGLPKDISCSPDAAYFDIALLKGAHKVRTFRAGDRMTMMGMKGRKKLKDIFIDEKVPVEKRRKLMVVLSGDDIIWVAGLRRARLAPVTGSAKKILKLTVREQEPYSQGS